MTLMDDRAATGHVGRSLRRKEPEERHPLPDRQSVLALADIPTEERGSLYLIRLVAFALILMAIVRKNRQARR